ncbi:MAG: hypothetical protein ACRDZM_04970 [Acidimicrobiia bacterium]
MSSTLVVPEGTTVGQSGSRRPPGRRHWVSAAVIGVIAAASLAIGESGGVSLAGLAERSLIEAHLDAWYGGDFDTANSLKAQERLSTGPSEARARGEVEYQAMLEAETDLRGCELLPPATMRCEVGYSNVLNHAVGKEPALVFQQFGISDGNLLFVAGPYLEDESLSASFRRFANLLFPADYQAACVEEPNYQPPSCAEFKLAHLEDWASWHRIEEG